jgi:hypothetical protein
VMSQDSEGPYIQEGRGEVWKKGPTRTSKAETQLAQQGDTKQSSKKGRVGEGCARRVGHYMLTMCLLHAVCAKNVE